MYQILSIFKNILFLLKNWFIKLSVNKSLILFILLHLTR